jgi:hypothetical protein
MQPMPSPEQISAGPGPPSRRLNREAHSAAAGIGHGAATPAPHPTRTADGTERGTLMCNGSPVTSSRIATALPNPVAQANAKAAAPSARFGLSVTRPSRSRRAIPRRVLSWSAQLSTRRSLRPQQRRRGRPRRDAPRKCSNDIGESERPEPDEDHRQGRDGRLGYDVDLLGEQIP